MAKLQGIDEILNMWDVDATIKSEDLGEALINTGKLHAKYLRIHTGYALKFRKLSEDLKVLKRNKFAWMCGFLGQDELNALNWEHNKRSYKTQSQKEQAVDVDPDVVALSEKTAMVEEVKSACSQILWEIKNRTTQLRSLVEYEKYLKGY